MVMRYHWGLGVGHVYSHRTSPLEQVLKNLSPVNERPEQAGASLQVRNSSQAILVDESIVTNDAADHKTGMGEDDDAWLEPEVRDKGNDEDTDYSDEEAIFHRHEMYDLV